MSESTKQNSGLAIAGLVLGIIAAATSFLPIVNNLSFFIALIGGILAVISLVGALKGKHAAKGLSIAGVVLAIVSCVVVLVTQSAYKTAIDTAVDKATNGSQACGDHQRGRWRPRTRRHRIHAARLQQLAGRNLRNARQRHHDYGQ